jgi:AraC family transcriptional regulator, arabinose operon regulatory protein
MDMAMQNLHYPMINEQGKREGFPRQRLFVLPPELRTRMAQHPLLRELLVTDAGVFPHAANHRVERAQGADTHLVLLCLSGRGWVRATRSEAKPVEPGDLVWLPAGKPHVYGADHAEPWTIEWVHFKGVEAEAWRDLLGLEKTGGMRRLGPEAAGRVKLGEVWARLENGYALPSLAAASAELRRALALAAGGAEQESGGRAAEERVAMTLERMRERLRQPMRLEEMAALAGMSVPHYCVLFRHRVGFSPVDWFNRLRIQRACELLDTTKFGVAEVAAQVGYEDPYYFTRSFRRVMGRSPRAYRSIAKG